MREGIGIAIFIGFAVIVAFAAGLWFYNEWEEQRDKADDEIDSQTYPSSYAPQEVEPTITYTLNG